MILSAHLSKVAIFWIGMSPLLGFYLLFIIGFVIHIWLEERRRK